MTKAEWISRLRKAKVLALELYPDWWCIADAAHQKEIIWIDQKSCNAKFSFGPDFPQTSSVEWMCGVKPSREQVALVFDESIRLAGGEP